MASAIRDRVGRSRRARARAMPRARLSLALLLDDFRLGLREELLVAQLAADLVQLARDHLGLLLEPLALLAKVDRAREVEEDRGALHRHLHGLPSHRLPAGTFRLL